MTGISIKEISESVESLKDLFSKILRELTSPHPSLSRKRSEQGKLFILARGFLMSLINYEKWYNSIKNESK